LNSFWRDESGAQKRKVKVKRERGPYCPAIPAPIVKQRTDVTGTDRGGEEWEIVAHVRWRAASGAL
jgi:hypothetical protein